MSNEDMIRELRNVADKYRGKVVHFGEVNITMMCEEVAKRLEELSQPKTDWIPCEVDMPKDETLMYWTTHEDGSIIMHGYLKRNGFIYNWEVDDLEKRKRQGKVVAWMPIFKPQPYKKEGAE